MRHQAAVEMREPWTYRCNASGAATGLQH